MSINSSFAPSTKPTEAHSWQKILSYCRDEITAWLWTQMIRSLKMQNDVRFTLSHIVTKAAI